MEANHHILPVCLVYLWFVLFMTAICLITCRSMETSWRHRTMNDLSGCQHNFVNSLYHLVHQSQACVFIRCPGKHFRILQCYEVFVMYKVRDSFCIHKACCKSRSCRVYILVQLRLRTEVLCTPSSTRPGSNA